MGKETILENTGPCIRKVSGRGGFVFDPAHGVGYKYTGDGCDVLINGHTLHIDVSIHNEWEQFSQECESGTLRGYKRAEKDFVEFDTLEWVPK